MGVGCHLEGNSCHCYFLVPILSRNENPNFDLVNMGAFFSFRRFCTCGMVTLTCFYGYSE